jgi:hypothetical protein
MPTSEPEAGADRVRARHRAHSVAVLLLALAVVARLGRAGGVKRSAAPLADARHLDAGGPHGDRRRLRLAGTVGPDSSERRVVSGTGSARLSLGRVS